MRVGDLFVNRFLFTFDSPLPVRTTLRLFRDVASSVVVVFVVVVVLDAVAIWDSGSGSVVWTLPRRRSSFSLRMASRFRFCSSIFFVYSGSSMIMPAAFVAVALVYGTATPAAASGNTLPRCLSTGITFERSFFLSEWLTDLELLPLEKLDLTWGLGSSDIMSDGSIFLNSFLEPSWLLFSVDFRLLPCLYRWE